MSDNVEINYQHMVLSLKMNEEKLSCFSETSLYMIKINFLSNQKLCQQSTQHLGILNKQK